jgi:hypothetical protein
MVAERLGVALNVDVESPFDPGLMKTTDPSSARAMLLRYLAPECERVYLDLELDADLAGGVHRDGPVSSRRARSSFFSDWLDANHKPSQGQRASSSAEVSNTVPLSDGGISVDSLHAALIRHQAALSKFESRIK